MSFEIVFLHDDKHTITQKAIINFPPYWEILVAIHPTVQMSLSDYHLFLHLKQLLQPHHFENYGKLIWNMKTNMYMDEEMYHKDSKVISLRSV